MDNSYENEFPKWLEIDVNYKDCGLINVQELNDLIETYCKDRGIRYWRKND